MKILNMLIGTIKTDRGNEEVRTSYIRPRKLTLAGASRIYRREHPGTTFTGHRVEFMYYYR